MEEIRTNPFTENGNPFQTAMRRDSNLQDILVSKYNKSHQLIIKYYTGEFTFEECQAHIQQQCHRSAYVAGINICLAITQPSMRKLCDTNKSFFKSVCEVINRDWNYFTKYGEAEYYARYVSDEKASA